MRGLRALPSARGLWRHGRPVRGPEDAGHEVRWLEAATRREPWSDGERRQLIIMMREVARRLKHGVGDCVMEVCQITREHAGDESPWQ